MSTLAIATLFPLDTVAAGDEANGVALLRRARQRGIDATLTTLHRPADMPDARIYLLGGEGTAGVAELVADLRATDLADRVRAGRATVFAVDAGLAAIARTWTDSGGQVHEGLGLVGARVRPVHAGARSVATRPEPGIGLPAMAGWMSAGAAIVREVGVQPLVEVLGSLGEPAASLDGVLADGVIGTGLHGPVLAVNPELADLVLARALGVRTWNPLPMPAAELARARRLEELAGPAEAARRRRRMWFRSRA